MQQKVIELKVTRGEKTRGWTIDGEEECRTEVIEKIRESPVARMNGEERMGNENLPHYIFILRRALNASQAQNPALPSACYISG